MQYRKKPVVIEAVRLNETNRHSCLLFIGKQPFTQDREKTNEPIYIETLEGLMRANIGDWIIKGVKGECYPCKNDIFEMTYEIKPESNKDKEKE